MRLKTMFATVTLIAGIPFSFAHAEGFKLYDLKSVEAHVADAFGNEFSHWSETGALSLEGPNDEVVMLEIDRRTDTAEQKTRTDTQFFEELEETCTNKGLPCEIETIEAGPALGRLTRIRLGGGMKGANIIILKNGDRLTIRSAAKDIAIAQKNAETAFKAVQNIIIGQ